MEEQMLSSTEKKRIRDRRAQRTLRERRDRHLKVLQQEVAECRRNHTELVRQLREENRALRHGNEEMQRMVHSCKAALVPGAPVSPSLSRREMYTDKVQPSDLAVLSPVLDDCNSQCTEDNIDPALTAPGAPFLASLTGTPTSDHALPIADHPLAVSILGHPTKSLIPVTQLLVQSPERRAAVPDLPGSLVPRAQESPANRTSAPSVQMLPPLVPAWMLVPSDEDPKCPITMATCPWLSRPDLIAECPDVPSPLDLLHGTRRNFLANSIHQSLRQRHCRDPEVLAMGWLVYLYSKWRAHPNSKAFARIPTCLRPVLGQLQKTHSACLDQIVWPRLRLNLMHYCPPEKLVDVMGLLSCCLKVRWKWGENILERDENDELRICQRFFDTFMMEEGWGVTSEFIDTHPELVEGIDVSQILFGLT